MRENRSKHFIISDINGRFNHLLGKDEYSSLAQCRTMDDLIAKLNHHFQFIGESMQPTVKELRNLLRGNIRKEIGELGGHEIQALEYLLDYDRIIAFFRCLETGEEAEIATLGEEFKGLASCTSLQEAERLYVRDSPIEKYFSGLRMDGDHVDRQEVLCRVLKNYFDYYDTRTPGGYFREILEREGDRQIFEVCLNDHSVENKRRYFPNATTLSPKTLTALENATSHGEIKELLAPGVDDPIAQIIETLQQIYYDAFRRHDDLSCVYAYFRLKEQEMSNILWIAECITQSNYDPIHEYVACK